MSERSVSENNKLWEAAERIAENAVAEKKAESIEERRKQKKRVVKLVLLMMLIALITVFASIAWFAMNKQAGARGMSAGAQDMPYTILTQNSSGYYKDKWEKTGSQAAEWLISSSYNFNNYGQDLNSEDDEPGLEPGSNGVLEFRVEPNTNDSITVDCVFDIKAYIEEIVKDEHGDTVLDENQKAVTTITEISNETLTNYIRSHIMLFSGYDPQSGKYTGLISTNEDLKRVLAEQRYTRGDTAFTKIYWAWPMRLENIVSSDPSNLIYDSTQQADVISYISANKDGFFKDCSDSDQKVASDLTALSAAYDNSTYNHYSMKYDNADLEIGNGISYVMLSMNVEQ